MVIYSIYKATNKNTGKSYIGFSSDWKSRKRLHKYNSNKNERNYIFYNSIRKHGFDAFQWEVLYQSKDKEHILGTMENHFIELYNTLAPNGYNMKVGGGGGTLTEDAKKKIGEKRKGMVFSDEHKKNLSDSHKGLSHTKEQKMKIGESVRKTLRLAKPVSCPFCGKSGRKSNMTRYHFGNCKETAVSSIDCG